MVQELKARLMDHNEKLVLIQLVSFTDDIRGLIILQQSGWQNGK